MNVFDSMLACFKPASRTGETYGVSNVKQFTYKELKNATDNFNDANKIGEGGFGSVHKGQLKNGKMAAIKVLSEKSKQGLHEFLTEIEVISKVEHENLVQLYGWCVEDDRRIVVYHYLENNSLQQRLLSGGHNTVHFSWGRRFRIGVGVANGLAFLHHGVSPYIVHRDIKASNILLDEDFNPKISDFGMAKMIPQDRSHVSTRVAGTLGYLAPEYAVKGQLTRQADIYSFGVLLLEIVSGKCNTNLRLPTGEQFLIEKAWKLHERGVLVTMVDEKMEGMFDTEQALRFLKVALLCTQESPKMRPRMSTVVKLLNGERKIDETKITKPGIITNLSDLMCKDPASGKSSGTTGFVASKGSSSSERSYQQLQHSTFSLSNPTS